MRNTEQEIREALSFCSNYDYESWYRIGMALKSGGYPLDLWCEWSSKDPSGHYSYTECQKKWNSFKGEGTTIATLFYYARSGGYETVKAIKESLSIPFKPDESLNQLKEFLQVMYEPSEYVGYCTEYKRIEKDGVIKWAPVGGVFNQTAQDLITAGIGRLNPEAGAHIRINPLNGQGQSDDHVTAFRNTLIECDDLPMEEQIRKIESLNLPVRAIITSGKRSIHAIVAVDADSIEQYRDRVEKTYQICENAGLIVDRANRNPSRYSRMPGIMRNGKRQSLIKANKNPEPWLKWYMRKRDRSRFHQWKELKDGTRRAFDIVDNVIVEDIISTFNIFNLNGILYHYRNGHYVADLQGTITSSLIEMYIYPHLLRTDRIKRVMSLLLLKHSIVKTEQELNRIPAHCIAFENGILDPVDMTMKPNSAEYLIINQLPHKWIPVHDLSGSMVKRFIESLIPAEDDRKMFLQFCGYTMTRQMNQQKFMILYGIGGTGKSVLLRMLSNAIGAENYVSVSLQQLSERFTTSALVGKIACIYADLPSEALKDTSIVKTIVGEDPVKGEYKGGAVFTFHPYCKLIFSANSIPQNRDERSNALYRRMLVLHIGRRAPEISNLEVQLQKDLQSFIYMAVMAYHDVLTGTGRITESERSKEEIRLLYESSDSVEAFMQERLTITGVKTDRIDRSRLYDMYDLYCTDSKMHALSRTNFFKALRDKGIRDRDTNSHRVFEGIKVKYSPDWQVQ